MTSAGRRLRSTAVAVGAAVVVAGSMTACGAAGDGGAAATTDRRSTTTTVWTDAPTSTVVVTTTSIPAPRCGPLTAEDVADVFGVEAPAVKVDHRSTGEVGCGFTVGGWSVSSSVAPVPDVSTTAPPSTLPPVPGVRSRSWLDLRVERGGAYVGGALLVHYDDVYGVSVINEDARSDTSLWDDGSPLAESTKAVTIALAHAVESHL